MNPERGSFTLHGTQYILPQKGFIHFAWEPMYFFTSINTRKIKFITYIYIHFIQNLDETSDIRAKIVAVKHLEEDFQLTLKQHQHPIRLQKAMVYSDVVGAMLPHVIGM